MNRNKKHDGNKPGQGHKARVAAQIKGSFDIDGDKHTFDINYDITITVEQLDYAVRQIANGIAEVANRVAKDGLAAVK